MNSSKDFVKIFALDWYNIQTKIEDVMTINVSIQFQDQLKEVCLIWLMFR